MEPLPCDETQVNPHNQYAVSKYAQELYALTLGRRYEIPTVVLRYSITQGPRQSLFNAYSGVLRIFSLCLLHDQPLPIYEDGRQLRDYIYVGDVVEANLLVMEREEADYQVFNVGSGRPTSVLDYARLLGELTGREPRLRLDGEFRWGDSRHIVSDITRLRSLGWEPTTPLETTARKYLEWLKEQPEVHDTYTEAARVMRRIGVVRSAVKGGSDGG
jgi:dTDP-L-rhamnose 4-epimerase